jgi:hypothetical protein
MDFAEFQRCYGLDSTAPNWSDCKCWDRDRTEQGQLQPDGNIDGVDFDEFAKCWTGPNVPYKVALPLGCKP